MPNDQPNGFVRLILKKTKNKLSYALVSFENVLVVSDSVSNTNILQGIASKL